MKKMKRLLVAMLSCLTAFACVAGMSACKKDEKTSESSQAPVSSESVDVSSEEASSEESVVECAHEWVLNSELSVAASCGVAGKNVEVCSLCEETKETEVAALEHDWAADTENSVDATCTEAGVAAEVCLNCGATQSAEIAALGHSLVVDEAVAPTCTEAGKEAGEHCEVCDYVAGGAEVAALGHAYEVTEEVAPSCTEAGKKVEVCANCGDVVETEIAALGHSLVDVEAVAATCTEAGKEAGKACTVCDYVEEGAEVAALGHSIVVVEAIAPTCTEAGKAAGEYCEVCDYIADGAIIDALGHNYIKTEIAASCVADGKVVEICSVCGDVVETVIPAFGHAYEVTEEVAPTCDASGKVVNICANCGNVAETVIDALGHTWVIDKDNSIAASCLNPGKIVENCEVCGETKESYAEPTGHTFLEENWEIVENPTCVSTGLKKNVCIHNEECKGVLYQDTNEGEMDHVWEEPYIKDAQAPTCTEDGWTAHRICSNPDCRFEEFSEELPALGHDWIETKGWAATCTAAGCEDLLVCANCGLREGGEEIEMLPHTWVAGAPSCEQSGECSVCGIVVAKLDHVERFNPQRPANCYTWGTTTYYYDCANCGKVDLEWAAKPKTPVDIYDEHGNIFLVGYHEITPAHVYDPFGATCTEGVKCEMCDKLVLEPSNHIWRIVDALEATCTDRGYDEYKVCLECGHIATDVDYRAGKVEKEYVYHATEALGHKYDYTDVYSAPTCTEDGMMYAGTCTVCGYLGGNVAINALGHKYKTVSETFANCTKEGVKVEICTVCQDKVETVTPALGHDMSGFIDAVVPTCTTIGWDAHYYCVVCNAIDSYVEYPALGHDFNASTVVPELPDDCDNIGNKEYYTCANGCDVIATYNATTDKYTIVAANKVASITNIDVIKHTIDPNYRDPATNQKTYVPALNPTCTTPGHIATGNCKYCGKAMDEQYYNEIGVDYIVPALRHDGERDANFDEFGNFVKFINSASRFETCQREEYCGICRTENWDGTAHDSRMLVLTAYAYLDPTCEYAGNIDYSVCECGQIWAMNADTNTLDCVKTYRKDRTGALVVDPTTLEYIPVAYFTKADVTLAKKNHSYDVLVEGYAATCTTTGLKEHYRCRFCGLEQAGNFVIPALGHYNSEDGKTCSMYLRCERETAWDPDGNAIAWCNELIVNSKRTEDHVYEALKDGAGNPVLDKDGNQVYGECVICGLCKAGMHDYVVVGKHDVSLLPDGVTVQNAIKYTCATCGKDRTGGGSVSIE